MSDVSVCKNCAVTIMLRTYAFGPEWVHYLADYPTGSNVWRYCRVTKAEPEEG